MSHSFLGGCGENLCYGIIFILCMRTFSYRTSNENWYQIFLSNFDRSRRYINVYVWRFSFMVIWLTTISTNFSFYDSFFFGCSNRSVFGGGAVSGNWLTSHPIEHTTGAYTYRVELFQKKFCEKNAIFQRKWFSENFFPRVGKILFLSPELKIPRLCSAGKFPKWTRWWRTCGPIDCELWLIHDQCVIRDVWWVLLSGWWSVCTSGFGLWRLFYWMLPKTLMLLNHNEFHSFPWRSWPIPAIGFASCLIK